MNFWETLTNQHCTYLGLLHQCLQNWSESVLLQQDEYLLTIQNAQYTHRDVLPQKSRCFLSEVWNGYQLMIGLLSNAFIVLICSKEIFYFVSNASKHKWLKSLNEDMPYLRHKMHLRKTCVIWAMNCYINSFFQIFAMVFYRCVLTLPKNTHTIFSNIAASQRFTFWFIKLLH